MSSQCEVHPASAADVVRLVADADLRVALEIQTRGAAWLYGPRVAPIAIGGIFGGEIWLHVLRAPDARTGAALVRVLRRQVAAEAAKRVSIASRAALADDRAKALHRLLGFRPTGVVDGFVTYERSS